MRKAERLARAKTNKKVAKALEMLRANYASGQIVKETGLAHTEIRQLAFDFGIDRGAFRRRELGTRELT